MSGPRGSKLPRSNSTQNHGRLIPPQVEGMLLTFAAAAEAAAKPPCSARPAFCWLSEGGRRQLWAARWQAPPRLEDFQSRTLSDLYMWPHIKERRQRADVSKTTGWREHEALSSRGKILRDQQDDEFFFSSKMGFVVPANEEVVTLFAENSPTWFQLWVNSPVIRNSSMIS